MRRRRKELDFLQVVEEIVLTAAVFCRVVNLAAVLFDRFLLIASSSASVNFAPFLRPRGVA